MAEDIDVGRRLARRRWAGLSFGFLLVASSSILGMLLLSPARESIAAALATASPVLIGLFAAFVSIMLGYLGFSAMEHTFKRDG